MKHDLNEVYKDFEKENITVLPFRFQHLKSVSLGDEKVVGIDRSKIDGCAESMKRDILTQERFIRPPALIY